MASQATTCPYCNALLSGPAEAGQRLLCTRCGECFTARAPGPSSTAGDALPAAEPAAPLDVTVPPRLSNRSIALAILGVMALMATVGLVTSLETVSFRRDNDVHVDKPAIVGIPWIVKVLGAAWLAGLALLLLGLWRRNERPQGAARPRWVYLVGVGMAGLGAFLLLFSGPIRHRNSLLPSEANASASRVVEPARLEALRYLPPDVDVIVGLHVDAMLQTAAGRTFLDNLKIGAIRFDAERLEGWAGMKREDVDYLVLGLRVEERLLPRVTLMVRSRRPVDGERLRERLKGTAAAGDDSGNRFRFTVAGTSLEAEAQCIPAAQFLVVALTRTDLETLPAEPHRGLDDFSPRVRTLLKERVDRGAQAWIVAGVNQWDRTAAAAWWLQRQPEEEREVLGKVRGLAISLVFEQALTARGEVECADAEAARGLAAYLKNHSVEDVKDVKVAEPKDAWVSSQLRMADQTLRQLMERAQ